MTKKKKMHEVEAREKEILSSPVNPTGAGEDPAVKAMLSEKFVTGTNMEALEMALAFQQMLKGEMSLSGDNKLAQVLSRIMQKMDEMDASAKRWEEDRENFVKEMNRMADKLRMTEAQQEELRARAALNLEEATAKARAEIVSDRKRFDDFIANEPKVNVVSPGVMEVVMENGVPAAKLYPEEIRIKHRRWILQPGKITEVPASVAAKLEERRRSQMETQERQEAMKSNLESSVLARRMKEIDQKYKSTTAHLGESESI